MKIKLICSGALKRSDLEVACQEFTKRIGRFATLEIFEIPQVKINNDKGSEVSAALLQEGKKILALVDFDQYLIALDRLGEQVSSEELAELMEQKGNYQKLVFVIGSAHGLSPEVLARANFILSFSPMTFPHLLARLVLLEQIYRAFTILNHHPYHK